MAKVKINNLPAGFALEDGKLVRKQMNHGGSTGDQVGFSLEKYPTRVTSQQMSESEDSDVRYSLSSVPRKEANLEAEGGETVLTDLNNDGNFGLYDIKGPRHSSGGVPMFLPEQSFIFSDTKALKMKGSELAEFGIETKKSMTPAKVSKRYGLNKFYGSIDDEFADDIQVKSAELMLDKNKKGLSKLAYAQELSKDFEDGVPLAAHPYLLSIGQDPIAFTAQVENISEQKAMMKAMQALSPEQQEQVLMLQQFLAQAEQMPQPQGQPQGMEPAPAPPSAEEQVAMAQQSVPGGPMSNGEMPMAKFGTEFKMYQDGGDAGDEPQDSRFNIEGGSPEFIEYYNTDPNYKKRIYDSYKIEMEKAGKRPVPESEFHKIYLDAQRRNYELYNYAETFNKENNLQPGDEGYIDIQNEAFDKGYRYADTEGGKKVDHGVSPELKELIESYNAANAGTEGFEPLTIPTKEETYTFQQGYRGSIYSEAAEQYKRKKEGKDYNEEVLGEFFSTGAFDEDADKRVLNPYWEQGDPEDEKYFKGISKADYRYGNTTLGQRSRIEGTRDKRDERIPPPKVGPCPDAEQREADCNAKDNHVWVPYNEADGTGCLCRPTSGDLGDPKPLPNADFWKQDLLKMNAIAQRQRELFLPFQPEVEDSDIDYVLEDPTRAIAAINEQANILNVANNVFAGAQAGTARSAATTGKTMKAVADAVASVQARNVSTANRGEYQNAMLDAQINRERRDRNVKEYDDTTVALQSYIDEKNFDREQFADAYANALTNRANTYNMNLVQDYFTIDPFYSAGMISQTGKRAFDPVEPVDQTEAMLNAAARLKRADIEPTPELLAMMVSPQAAGTTTNIKAEYDRMNQNPNLQYNTGYQGNISATPAGGVQGKRGKELKKYAVPFYQGKTGI